MADMLHQIQVQASPDKVYEALTAQAGLRGWWTADSVAEPTVGSVAEFGFYNRANLFQLRIDELQPGQHVAWTCLGRPEEWKGTRVVWELAPKDGGADVRFTQSGWRSTEGGFALVNSTWGALMFRLKDYLEGRASEPFFPG